MRKIEQNMVNAINGRYNFTEGKEINVNVWYNV